MKKFLNRTTTILSSRRFFYLTLAFFAFEAVWIALSAVYPMAFDESFHFGLIRLYSHYWLPFLSSQPPHSAAYGAVSRDPSYLYHYLMSFPYRLIALVVHGQTGQVIAMRLIDVGLFGFGLVLFRRVLLRARVSPALTHLSLLLFVLIPIVPQLAAHVNYDDLLFPVVAGICLLTFRLHDEMRTRHVSARTLTLFLAVGLLGTQTKYAFAPIFAGAVVFLLLVAWKTFRHKWREIWAGLSHSWRAQSRHAKVLLAILLVVAVGLFAQRDGLNLVEYHTFTPDCSKVASIQSCSAYGPWQRNYTTHKKVLSKAGSIHYENPIVYLGSWAYWMWYRLFFAITGPTHGYTNYPPLPLPAAATMLIGVVGIVSLAIWRRRIFRGNPYLTFFCFVIGFYVLSLWVDGYAQYRYTDELVTMNGRYLLPILLLMAAIVGQAFSLALRHAPTRKAICAVAVIVLFVEGGGVLTFITRSDPTWDWPNSAVVKVNDVARKIVQPVVIEGSKSYGTSHWFFN